MNAIMFHLAIVPPKATSQSAGKRMMIITDKVTGKPKPMFFKNKDTKQAEHDFTVLLQPFRPPAPIDNPIKLEVDIVWPWRATEPNWRRALGRVYHTSKPDCSNWIKQMEDCMTKLQFWNDDGQVAILHVSKAWGDQVGIFVRVIPLEIQERPVAPPKPPKESKRKNPPSNQPSLF
jgi:Holliday junction resolvase RusA-like endonuclease